MSEQMQAEFKKLFDEFAAKKIEIAPDEWHTMSHEEIFTAGCIASRQALVVELPDWDGHDATQRYMDAVTHKLIQLGVNVK